MIDHTSNSITFEVNKKLKEEMSDKIYDVIEVIWT